MGHIKFVNVSFRYPSRVEVRPFFGQIESIHSCVKIPFFNIFFVSKQVINHFNLPQLGV